MVTRKVLPQRSADAPGSNFGGGGFTADDVPDVLRPGHGLNPSTATNQYANFEAEEESVWRQTGQQQQQQQQQQQPAELPAEPQTGDSLPVTTTAGLPAMPSETNPFKRKMLPTSGPASNSFSAAPTHPPGVPLQPPSSGLSQLSLSEPDNNPWQPALPENSRHNSPAPPVSIPDAKNVWVASEGSSERPSRRPSPSDRRDTGGQRPDAGAPHMFDSQEDSAGWNEVASPIPATATVQVNPAGEAPGEGWDLVDVQGSPAPEPLSRQSTWENFTDDEDDTTETKNKETKSGVEKGKSVAESGSGPAAPEPASGILIQIDSPTASEVPQTHDNQKQQGSQATQGNAVAGPVRGETSQASPRPAPGKTEPSPQPPIRSMLDVGDDVHPPPRTPKLAERDKTGTYQIKNISWHDARATKNPRISPILLQNANGPCPLVALVNVLTLTTPAEASTGLVEALRSREQVSLSLLLDAVFDELMSTRRAESEYELPDVDELYSFLKSLHTGMNVNPRFIPTPDVVAAFRRSSLTHLHPTERDGAIPGSFEYTREMKLYSTFGIPLIHGWLPAPTEGVYGALSRNAASYEDVQNLLFREEELEDKLSSPSNEGLSEEEQHLYHDILEIKTFLHVSATQLTPYGLDVIRQAMQPGSFAILFRNDHFSTLYRHPDTMQLLSLVTDAGYATHDEVIWETLVDVNGEHAEFYSGDFRLVGGSGGGGQQSGRRESSGAGRRKSHGKHIDARQQEQGTGAEPDYEQEDHDLALALQLQEEEEERHRAEEARRRRESQLSEQFIEQQARRPDSVSPTPQPSNAAGGGRYSSGSPALAPPRRSSAGAFGSASGSPASRPAAGNTTSHGRTSSQQLQPPLPPRRSQQQHVRPLVPPLDARPPIHRPADPEDGDEAPPSYEQASKQAPYHPPPGAPGSDRPVVASGSGAGGRINAASPRPRPGVSPASGRPYVTPGVYSTQPPRPQQLDNRERDCIVM